MSKLEERAEAQIKGEHCLRACRKMQGCIIVQSLKVPEGPSHAEYLKRKSELEIVGHIRVK